MRDVCGGGIEHVEDSVRRCGSQSGSAVANRARDEPLYSLQHGRFVVTKTVEAESFYMRWLVGVKYVPLFPCFDGFSRQSFVA